VTGGGEAQARSVTADKRPGPRPGQPGWLADPEQEDARCQPLPGALVDQPFDAGTGQALGERLPGTEGAGLPGGEGE
jgi:hypothetical protein